MTLPLQSPPQSLCLLRLSAIGDVTHVVPVVQSIQRQWPQTKITWIIGKLEAKLVGDLPGIEFIVFDKSKGWQAYRDVRKALRGRRFDVLMHMQVALRANLLAALVRADVRLGYDRVRSRDMHGLFINQRVPWIDGQHVLDLFFTFAETLGLEREALRWEIPIPAEAQAFAHEQIPDGQRTLLISPASSHPLRNWRAERYAAVADYAMERHGLQVILCGGPTAAERHLGDEILSHMRRQPLDLIGRDTLKRMLALLARAELLISPDSGPMHMATCVGTRVIGLHAASNPRRSGPYRSLQWCVDKYDAAARRYRQRPASELRWGTRLEYEGVMDLIEVEDVIARLDEFMRARERTALF
jgi:heptosyltransferase I